MAEINATQAEINSELDKVQDAQAFLGMQKKNRLIPASRFLPWQQCLCPRNRMLRLGP